VVLEAVGGTARAVVGFEHHHIEPMQGGQAGAAEPTEAAADHDQVTAGGGSGQG
jgi:hypothetical protein